MDGFNTYEKQDRVLVGMSGGVDSSVTVRILQEQGFAVEGAVIRFSPVHEARGCRGKGCRPKRWASGSMWWDAGEAFEREGGNPLLRKLLCRPYPQPLYSLQPCGQVPAAGRKGGCAGHPLYCHRTLCPH